jgi:ubiquinol-cytochrome c reductase cytochrome b subunit
VLEAHRAERLIAPTPRHILPLPTPGRVRAQVRARLNHFYTRYQLETPSGENGQGRIEDPGLTERKQAESDGSG